MEDESKIRKLGGYHLLEMHFLSSFYAFTYDMQKYNLEPVLGYGFSASNGVVCVRYEY